MVSATWTNKAGPIEFLKARGFHRHLVRAYRKVSQRVIACVRGANLIGGRRVGVRKMDGCVGNNRPCRIRNRSCDRPAIALTKYRYSANQVHSRENTRDSQPHLISLPKV